MKNMYWFILLIAVIFFGSCTKNSSHFSLPNDDLVVVERSATIQLPVSKVSYSLVSGELLVDFSGEFDLTEAVVEATQFLKFEDTSGNESTLTFQTSSYTGGNESLEIYFSMGSNNLTGLTLVQTQEIIIEDDLFE